jgi:hypothetical protein
MGITSRNTIRATIEGRLATELAGDPVIPVVFHNMEYKPTPNSSWVQCNVSFGSSSHLTHGGITDASNRLTGVLVVNVFSAKSVGAAANLTISKRIRDLYNRNIVSGVFFDAPIGPEVVATPSPEGYYQTQVRVTFDFIEEL